MRDFVSNLAGKLNDFLDYKHALGIKYDTCRVYLLELDDYNLEHGNRNTLTKEMTEGWAIWHAGKSESQDRSWIPPIREFGRYLQSIGEKMRMFWMTGFLSSTTTPKFISCQQMKSRRSSENVILTCSAPRFPGDPMYCRHYTGFCIAVECVASRPENLNA